MIRVVRKWFERTAPGCHACGSQKLGHRIDVYLVKGMVTLCARCWGLFPIAHRLLDEHEHVDIVTLESSS